MLVRIQHPLLFINKTSTEQVKSLTIMANRQYFIPLPDEVDQFYAFVNLVINNKNNVYVIGEATTRPKKIGWVNVYYTRNEVNEPFVVVNNLKEKCFVEMILNQFYLIREHWETIIAY